MQKPTENVDDLITDILDDYLRRKRIGERPDIEDYIRKHPEYEAKIRQAFEIEQEGEALFSPFQAQEEELLTGEELNRVWTRIERKLVPVFKPWWANFSVKEWVKKASQKQKEAIKAVNEIANWLVEQLTPEMSRPLVTAGVRVRGARVGLPGAIRARGQTIQTRGAAVRTRGDVSAPEEIQLEIDRVQMTDKGKFLLELNAPQDIPEHQLVNVVLETNQGKLILGEFPVEGSKVKVELDLRVEGKG